MSDSHETSSAARQWCPGSSLGMGTLAVLALFFIGCVPERWGCVSSSQCEKGLVCVHWEPGRETEERFCAKPCAVEQDTCDTGEACMCPDSPLKQRCFNDDGERIAICSRW